jgi:hypothetical protein
MSNALRGPSDLWLQVIGLTAFSTVLIFSLLAWRKGRTTSSHEDGYVWALFLVGFVVLIVGVALLLIPH